METYEIAEMGECTTRSVYNFKSGQGFSKKRAVKLEKQTGIHRLYWLFPLEYDEKGMPRDSSPSPAPPLSLPPGAEQPAQPLDAA